MPPPSPTLRRRRIAAELRRLREERGLTLDHAARELGVARSTMSRIENAQVSVRLSDLRTLLELYGVHSDEAASLVQAARDARLRGWWHAYSDVLPSWHEVYVGLEQEASEICVFEVALVPNLLQTADYARAVLRAELPGAPATEIERRTEVRMKRQHEEGRSALRVVLDEAAVRRVVGGPAVMRAQLERLVAGAEAPELTVQVVPFGAGAHPSMIGSFSILAFPEPVDPPVVYVESLTGSLHVEGDDTEVYARTFRALQAAALPAAESLELIREAAKAM
ncbi:helix-turn-helix domain-containing protein [Planosporangium thailandense]|uniref:Helix-turn-helix domain-containing protein n=1 Tax=Planosporangium thailandense TaxID=765197 RepID=A0ABX0XVL3_9ACTN|nr:helix-turn-helix transcriptional regulator [Planosporangium thailandense]NJC70078.1 helix-turn-helix domain-containing protein [Planosporangium thailandense]